MLSRDTTSHTMLKHPRLDHRITYAHTALAGSQVALSPGVISSSTATLSFLRFRRKLCRHREIRISPCALGEEQGAKC